MIKTKILDMNDLQRPDFMAVNDMFNKYFGNKWPQVPLRRWEYVAAILFSGILAAPGKTLETGCGVSVFSPFLVKIGCEAHACDIGAIGQPGVNYYNMTMTDLKFDDQSFDYVFAISSIEHVNAGKFAIPNIPFDTGDEVAMAEMLRVLKPNGTIVITTDFAKQYYPPPGLWPSGSHRIYNWEEFNQRLILPFRIDYDDEIDLESFDFSNIKNVEPTGYAYTEFIATLKK